ncbi:hypothetical protein V1514DRAFT_322517 [Lipomyces japonicus]|uniref:uncharacterized protein n=1 Tax=Lipomyces japonicus TaxID=56871 RepID=UPI0034CE2EF8
MTPRSRIFSFSCSSYSRTGIWTYHTLSLATGTVLPIPTQTPPIRPVQFEVKKNYFISLTLSLSDTYRLVSPSGHHFTNSHAMPTGV